MSLTERILNGWNAFMGRDPTYKSGSLGYSSSRPPGQKTLTRSSERTIINSIYNRIAVDVSAVDICHVRVDENGNFKEEIKKTGLSRVLTMSANIDQTGRQLVHDAVLSMFDEGYVALVPVDTNTNPVKGTFDIQTLRTGQILEWYPSHVKLRVYNERDGHKHDIVMPKHAVAIVVNPFYEVMNRPNSTLQRLVRKLTLLDTADERSNPGRLDMIIQLPYTIKTETRREQAEKRKADIESQLNNSKLGIAYTDGTEKIIQLNRGVENNLQTQIEYLTSMLYSQLGLTKEVFDGTADEKTMLNYNNRTIVPILTAFVEEMTRKFLSPTAITQGQRIRYIPDPFRLVTIGQIAEIADKFTRNEIFTSNEVRGIVGFRPADSPEADELRNKNMPRPTQPNLEALGQSTIQKFSNRPVQSG